MPFREFRVFVDTSVLIAGLASVTGASAAVLDLAEAGVIKLVISRQVVIEADRNVTAKLPIMVERFRAFLRRLAPELEEDPSPEEIKTAAVLIHPKDASILAAALKSKADFLVTLDKKHFLSIKTRLHGQLKIVTPAEFIKRFEQVYLEIRGN